MRLSKIQIINSMNRTVTTLPVTEYPVAPGNYDTNRVYPLTQIILHTEVGFKAGTETTFDNPQSHVSVHYGVNQDGSIDHYVDETNVAYQAGNYAVNQSSIGIEHEDLDKPDNPRPDSLYTASAKLVADICTFYEIPCDRDHIKKHSEIISTSCPDTLDCDRIVLEAQKVMNPTQPLSALPANYDDIIRKSTGYDSVCAYFELPPTTAWLDIKAKLDQVNSQLETDRGQITALQEKIVSQPADLPVTEASPVPNPVPETSTPPQTAPEEPSTPIIPPVQAKPNQILSVLQAIFNFLVGVKQN